MDRDNAEVFYSKVSDLEELFYCLPSQLQYIIGGEQPVIVQIKRACELSNACTVVIRAALNYKKEHETWYPLSEGLTVWYCQPVVRNGLWCVASFMLQLLKESVKWKENLNWYSELEQLTDVLLESYCGAVNAKVERREEHGGLLDEYWMRRDLLLGSLYKHFKDFVDDKYQHLAEGVEESKEDLRNLSSPFLFIARRHEAYETLWNVCCDLNDSVLLRYFMHKSVGPKGGFSYYVFKQLHENRQFAKLLRIGEEFQEELNIFLRQHKNLLWFHEVFLNHFSCASETLHALALSQEYAASATEEDTDTGLMRTCPSMADRKRLLNLSKIAAMAGKDDDFAMQTKCMDAELKILKLQEEIIALLGKNEETRRLPPEELVELCLVGNTPELLLRAFEVFAWTSSSFRQSNVGLLEECWKNAADQNNWGKLHQDFTTQGWSDKQVLQKLSETVLFQASERCYGPWAETFEGGFDEVLPLRQGDMMDSQAPLSSVEGIIMQHKDFCEAHKLMLTAIMFSKVGVESIAKEQGILPLQ